MIWELVILKLRESCKRTEIKIYNLDFVIPFILNKKAIFMCLETIVLNSNG